MSAEDWFLNDYEYGDIEYGEKDELLPTTWGVSDEDFCTELMRNLKITLSITNKTEKEMEK